MIAEDVLHLPVKLHDQPEFVVGVLISQPLPGSHHRTEHRGDRAERALHVQVNDNAPPVLRVPLAADEARLLQPVEDAGDRGRCQPGRLGQLAGCQLAAEAQDVEAVQVGRR